MSRYGSVTIAGPASLISRIVQAAEADILQSLVNDAIAGLPQGYVVVDITLAGAGDGHTFTVTIEAGATADVTGGFETPPSVACFLASEAQALLLQNQVKAPTSGTVADVQVAGAAKGTRFMGMFVSGVVAGGGGDCPPIDFLIWVGVTTPATTTPDGSACAPYPTLAEGVAAAQAMGTDGTIGILIAPGFGAETLALSRADNDSKRYSFVGIGGAADVQSITLDLGTFDTGEAIYSFTDIACGSSFVISNGGANSILSITWRGARGVIPLAANSASTPEIPGLDDVAFTGTIVRVSTEGCFALQSWNAVHTDLISRGTLFGQVPGDFGGTTISVNSFLQIDDCRFQNIALIAVAAPTDALGGFGFTACVFAGAGSFTGPAASFVVDDLSGSTFISSGSTASAGATSYIEGLQYGLYADRPAPTLLPGRPFIASDGTVEFRTDSIEWRPVIDGVVGKQVPLVASWTLDYGTQGTATDVTGTTYLTVTGGVGVQAFGKSIAYAVPTEIICNVDVIGETSGNIGALQAGASAGVYVANGNDAILWTMVLADDTFIASPGIAVLQFTAPGAGGIFAPGAIPQISNIGPSPVHWLSLEDDGANIIVQYSVNGRNWFTFGTYSYATIGFTPSHIGIIGANRSGLGIPVESSFRSLEIIQ